METSLKKKRNMTPVQIISLSYVCLIAFGTLLLSFPFTHNNGNWFGFFDALFTSTSAVCVTGLTVVQTATEFNLFGQIIIMFLIQFGGLGFMTITTMLFVFIGKKITLKDRLVLQEQYGQNELQGLVKITMRILLVTLITEFVGAVIMSFSLVPIYGFFDGVFKSLFQSVSAFCNAGFDIFGSTSGMALFNKNVLMLLSTAMLIVVGGIGFSVMFDIYNCKCHFSKYGTHTKVVLIMSGILTLFGMALIMLLEWNNSKTIGNMGVGEKILNSFFQSVSPRTAGFAAIAQEDLTSGGKLITMILMFIGASPTSTGGGIKTTTLFIMFAVFISGIREQDDAKFAGRALKSKQVIRAMSILFLSMLVICFSALLISIIESYGPYAYKFTAENVMFETISAFSTVGLSLGITSYLSQLSQTILVFVMLIGRLGALFLGLFMIKKNNTKISYPEMKIIIG